MSLLNKIFWHLNICPLCHGKTDDWTNLQTCMSNECGYEEISRPKKYKYRVRSFWKSLYSNGNCFLTWGIHKYYMFAWFHLKFNKLLLGKDIKHWISKEEIGRERTKKQ